MFNKNRNHVKVFVSYYERVSNIAECQQLARDDCRYHNPPSPQNTASYLSVPVRLGGAYMQWYVLLYASDSVIPIYPDASIP